MSGPNKSENEREERSNRQDRRLCSPSIARNKEPILQVLNDVFTGERSVLEIACGTGEHGAFFASHIEGLSWLPTDVSDAQFESVNAWRADGVAGNVMAPTTLDASEPPWLLPGGFVPDAIVCINMIHITPWAVTRGLFAGAGELLPVGGVVFVYGPFSIDSTHTAPSNAAFDASLKSRNHEWGIRDLAEVAREADLQGLHLERKVSMPANNFSLIFRKTDHDSV